MGVGVFLKLFEPVTVRQLRIFLSFVDEETDVDADLRVGFVTEIGAAALAVQVVDRDATGGA